MLKSTTNSNNLLLTTDTNNAFTTHCQHMLRLDDISKLQRDQIMKSWPKPESTALDLPVLALKVKVMRHPAIYEGMRFKDLIELADTLAEADLPHPQEHLALLKELTRLIFVYVYCFSFYYFYFPSAICHLLYTFTCFDFRYLSCHIPMPNTILMHVTALGIQIWTRPETRITLRKHSKQSRRRSGRLARKSHLILP